MILTGQTHMECQSSALPPPTINAREHRTGQSSRVSCVSRVCSIMRGGHGCLFSTNHESSQIGEVKLDVSPDYTVRVGYQHYKGGIPPSKEKKNSLLLDQFVDLSCPVFVLGRFVAVRSGTGCAAEIATI
jgi:hypothetical protein